ncbi:MAG: HupE/UreJ family protein [Cyanobacteriota bacterium]|nr:HupE/UreJ family protein [Cyanobacteriota bacterium]
MSLAQASRRAAAPLMAAVLLLAALFTPALAHHPFGLAEGASLNAWQGLASGIGHPLLGPDHLLFLLAIGFVGLARPQAWLIPLLAVGLGGSALSQLVPLPEALGPWAESLVAISLALEGLVALSVLPAGWLLPLFALHGVLLGSMVVGAEPTPLLAYFVGLLLSQGALLLVVTALSARLLRWLGHQGQRLAAGIWIGIGCAFAWGSLVP